jgi:hypothetical protein
VLLLFAIACPSGFADPSREYGAPIPAGAELFPEHVHTPPSEGVWHAPITDADPTLPRSATCRTCHGQPVGDAGTGEPAPPPGGRFHTGIALTHGDLSCEQCHDRQHTGLHLADGRALDFSQVIDLCSQCHGPQREAYEHGAHGGMNGAWDRRLGPTERNTCTDCHAAHAPAFQRVMPVFPPRDRFLGVN